MDLPKHSFDEKKSKLSFWNKLLRLPRKSNSKEKQEESFRRQSAQYSSLTTPKDKTKKNSTSDESENFITLESSALQDVHRDAGILFLNKNSFENCFAPREENKHVQFAPTPMNKYYKVDIKSAPVQRKQDEDKENLQQIKPTRPILRVDKNRKSSSSAEDTESSNPEKRLLQVTYVNGPTVKTPTIPRTSTKIALVDRKIGSMPQLNVSNIVKYNSLPRNPKILEENLPSRKKEHFISQSGDVKTVESLCSHPNICQITNPEQNYRRSMRVLNSHRQSCYGVSDPSRIFEGKKVLQIQNRNQIQTVDRRLSLEPSLRYNQSDVGHQTEFINPKNVTVQDQQKNSKRFYNLPAPSKIQGYARSLDQPVGRSGKHGFQADSNTNKLYKHQYHASTGHIPNKAINEVGLPIIANKKENMIRSKSPQYIPLSETFTTNKIGIKNSGSLMSNNYLAQKSRTNELSEQTTEKIQKDSCLGSSIQTKKQVFRNAGQNNELPSRISETRKQAILSAMYTQKRKLVNKICKYNSKQSDEGFSSMADDECSFNCSCPSCITKLSKSYKRSGLKQLFSYGKEKYFFTIEPEIKEGNELERLPENQTFEGPMALAQPHLSNKNEGDSAQNKTWYECNDTLCETPGKCNSLEPIKGEGFSRKATNKVVENLYENITQIINSATKKNLTPQDVKKLLSTPISSSVKSHKAPQKNLFPDESSKGKFDSPLKESLTPANTSDCFNDSIVLLQEIFQKLSQECKELLQPGVSLDQTSFTPVNRDSPGSKYVNDLVKNLKSSELSEADFASIIGGIAQNIFSETKAKKGRARTLVHSTSLPDLQKKVSLLNKAIGVANSLRDLCDLQIKGESIKAADGDRRTHQNASNSILSGDSALPGSRQLPDGWSKTPTTENSNLSSDVSHSTKLSTSGTDKDSSKFSEGELQLLENAIRIGMGLAPVDKLKKTPIYATSPTKAAKYKSRDVLSGKGKLKLKIYYNSGLVTVYVMKAAKLDWANGRNLNAYVKITMVPDESKRVHWRTNVQKAQKNPVFNQKFSFELLAQDVTKRLVFSVWHRDYAKQRSELIGCMSFSVRHVMDNTHNVDGWYRLLRERFGTQKHFAANVHKNNCSIVR